MDFAQKSGVCLGVVAALLTGLNTVHADSTNSEGLEEIIVTAQKREQKLSETPLSVTALSSENLKSLAATQFRDFANTVPGLSFTTSGVGSTQVNLRGITTGTNVSPTVGIYVNEVPYGSSTVYAGGGQLALDAGLFDLSRVEVLRGPQGTLYGASTMGGLLKYVTTTPDLQAFGGTARAGIATTEDGGVSYDVASAVNMPFDSGKAAARVSGFYAHDGGYIDNLALDEEDVSQSDVYGGRADLLFQPTDQLSIRLDAYLQKISRDGSISADYDIATGKPVDGSLDQRSILKEPFDQKFELFSATIDYDFGSAKLTSVTGYQSLDNDSFLDASDLYVPLFYLALPIPPFPDFGAVGVRYAVSTDRFTQELRLAGTGPTFDWIVGGYYTDEDSNQDQDVESWAPDGSPIGPLVLGQPMGTLKFPTTYEETAGFGTLTWHATSKLDVAGGLRYSHNSQTQEQISAGWLLPPPQPEQESSDSVATYLANLRYVANDNLMTYFRFATGYRPGGPNVVVVDPATGEPLGTSTFDADKLQSYEGGIKVGTTDRRLSADAAVYLIAWDDMQVVDANNGFGAISNAGSAESMGAELTLTALPTPAITLRGTFAYIDAELTEDAPDLGGKNGDPLPNTPDFAAAVSADYAFDLQEHASSVGVVLRYVADRVSGFDENAYPNWDLPSYTTVDLRGSVAFGSANLRLYVRNLFDERGQLSASTALTGLGGPAQVDILQPRTIGMSLDVEF